MNENDNEIIPLKVNKTWPHFDLLSSSGIHEPRGEVLKHRGNLFFIDRRPKNWLTFWIYRIFLM